MDHTNRSDEIGERDETGERSEADGTAETPETAETDGATETADADGKWDEEVPMPVVEEAERLTRLARAAIDDAETEAYRDERAEELSEHGFEARVREDDDTLVLYPDEWLEDGTVRVERIDDTDRAVEVSLSGPGDPDDWQEVESHNAALVDEVAEEHGPIHGANARAFADFMGNHYARPMESATADEVREFLDDYFRRNAWPTKEQRDAVEASVRHVFDAADERTPL